MVRVIALIVLFSVFFTTAKAQEDSVIVETQDTVLIKSYAERYDPRKALLFAAVLPGLGQIYNKKYWKLPLVYGGLFAAGYAVNYYNGLYRDYRSMVFRAIEIGVGENERNLDLGMRTTLSQYRIAVDKSRRERDYMIIIMGAVYILQIIDAHVDAHLKEFDLNPRLQVSIEPMMEQTAVLGRQTGASLVIKF